MNIVIVGCGRLGSSLAEEFSIQGHDVTVIDNTKENFKRLGNEFYGRVISCVEIDDNALTKAGISKADIFLAVTADDNINIMLSQIAKKLHGVKNVIARNNNPSYEFIYRKLGIEVISEVKLATDVMKNKVFREME